jgi:hypothetical protein
MLSVVLAAMLTTGVFVPDPTPPPVITQSSGTRYVPKVDRSAPRATEGAGSR